MSAATKEKTSPAQADEAASFLAWLVAANSLTSVLAERVARVHAETSDRLGGVLLKLGMLSERVLADRLAGFYGLQRFEPAGIPAAPVPLDALSPEFLRANYIIRMERRKVGWSR
jgi:general secretion pathway protein E